MPFIGIHQATTGTASLINTAFVVSLTPSRADSGENFGAVLTLMRGETGERLPVRESFDEVSKLLLGTE